MTAASVPVLWILEINPGKRNSLEIFTGIKVTMTAVHTIGADIDPPARSILFSGFADELEAIFSSTGQRCCIWVCPVIPPDQQAGDYQQ